MTASLLSQRPAEELLKEIEDKKINPKHLLFEPRKRIIDMLRAEGWGLNRIAATLRCSERTVKRYIRVIKKDNLTLVKKYDREYLGADAIAMAETLVQKSIQKGKYELAWQITKELPEVLQSLGLAYKEPEKFMGVVATVGGVRADVHYSDEQLAKRVPAFLERIRKHAEDESSQKP